MKTTIWTFAFLLLLPVSAWAQCCAGGAGSPIAGGASQGVLMDGQLEINANYQMISTDKFLSGAVADTGFFHSLSTNYLYFRVAYGLSERLTMSVETGYFLNKTQVELGEEERISSSGIGDLIFFPRYNIWKRKTEKSNTELTLGLGIKLPLGAYNDSIGHVEPFSGNTYYVPKPQAVQPSSGANDFIFYSFFYRGYYCDKIRLFANSLYIRKGWNPRGEKMGDFGSVGLFAGYSILPKLNATASIRGEIVGQTEVNPDLLMFTAIGYDPAATGHKKLFAGLQLGYSPMPGLMLFASTEYPLYQYVNATQIASQYQVTAGVSFRQRLRMAGAE